MSDEVVSGENAADSFAGPADWTLHQSVAHSQLELLKKLFLGRPHMNQSIDLEISKTNRWHVATGMTVILIGYLGLLIFIGWLRH